MESTDKKPSTHITQLPVEVLETIFGFLIGNQFESDLLNATLVCKQWHLIISHSISLMDKLNLTLGLQQIAGNHFELATSRQHRHVIIHKRWLARSQSTLDSRIVRRFISEVVTRFTDCLTTFSLHEVSVSPEQIKRLSLCKVLRTLELKSVECLDESQNENGISRSDESYPFSNLIILRILNCPQNTVLNLIDCKQLDVFEVSSDHGLQVSGPDSGNKYFGRCNIINFMNQLVRCDAIVIDIQSWHFDVQLKPAFLWRKLKLRCIMLESEVTDMAISSITALCQASQLDAESEICMEQYRETGCVRTHRRDGTYRLWLPILNNCRNITSLELDGIQIPSVSMELNNLSDVRKLKIKGDMLSDAFSHLTRKFPSVGELEICMTTCYMGGYAKVNLSAEAELLLQPFFDQITTLTIPDQLYEQIKPNERTPSRLFHNAFGNLRALTVRLDHSKPTEVNLGALLNSFSPHNNNLDLILQADSFSIRYLIDYQLLECYNAPFKTCNITVAERKPESRTNFARPTNMINWRQAGMDELELFGRLLDEGENRFFV